MTVEIATESSGMYLFAWSCYIMVSIINSKANKSELLSSVLQPGACVVLPENKRELRVEHKPSNASDIMEGDSKHVQ